MNSRKHFTKLPLYLVIVYFLASIPLTIYLAQNATQPKQLAQSAPSPTPQYVYPTFNCLANTCPTINISPTGFGIIIPSNQATPSISTSFTPNPSSPQIISSVPNPSLPQTSPPTNNPCISTSISTSTQNYSHSVKLSSDEQELFDLFLKLINMFLEWLGLPPINITLPNPLPNPNLSPIPNQPCISNMPIVNPNPSTINPNPSTTNPNTSPQPLPNTPTNWTLTWSDEFNGTSGSAIDTSKWTAETGGGGWGNSELEYYTNRTENASMDGNGNLVITAIKENLPGSTCWYGACQYTSARLITKGKFDTQYGKIEARIKVPFGQGIWPAFWTLGSNIDQVSWPASGEIDIMEMIGKEPSINHGVIHQPSDNPAAGYQTPYTLPSGQKFADDFHTFAIEWSENTVKFYVNNNLYETRTPANSPGTWAFNHPMYLLLNVATGGEWPGSPDATTIFPQKMLVDYVRVYKQQ